MSYGGSEQTNDETTRNGRTDRDDNKDGDRGKINFSKMEKFLTETAKKCGLTDPSFHFTKGSKDGDNYMGIVYRTEIVGKNKNGQTETVRCFLKCVPTDTFHREVLHARKMFLREVYFYEEVLPVFQDLDDEHMANSKYAPLFYGSNQTPGAEVLILEDLNCHGFEMKKTKILDFPHASLAIRRLGEFHAYSFATRAKKPAEFEKFKRMEEPLFIRKDTSESGVRNRWHVLCEMALKSLSGEEKHYTQKLRIFLQNLNQNMKDAANGNSAEPYAVVNHGDAWTNNMLFKYEKGADGSLIPSDHRFLDFQLCRYASPALDIAYMLFCCCTQEFRNIYYDQLLREYYRSLSERLIDLGCDPATLFPFEAVTEQLERFGKFAIGMAIFVIHIFTDEKHEITEITEDMNEEALKKRMEEDHFYRNMLRDSLKDMIDRKYL